jgi:Ca2+-binding RTX toxin-like protein
VIDQIRDLVETGFINTYQPDVVLLMLGTNDTNDSTLNEMAADLNALIDQIQIQQPNAYILVSSLPPIDPTIKGEARAQLAAEFNALLPQLISAQGDRVRYVNAGGSLGLSDLSEDGLHPTAAGYDKLGDAWYKALTARDTLANIENLVGSAFPDRLTGDASVNVIEGNAGNDLLTGKGGVDTFVYKSAAHGGDTITDFDADDFLQISASGFAGGLIAGADLSLEMADTGVFVSSAAPIALGTVAHFLYNTATGLLSFDADGSGEGESVAIATLQTKPTLRANQFRIV